MVRALTLTTLRAAAVELAARDRRLDRILGRLGTPPLWARRPGFATLVQIILEQQVSLAAARTLYRRVARELGGMVPAVVHRAGVEGLRALGLTRQKALYCHEAAARVLDGRLDLSRVASLPEVEGRALLRELPGIGPWSVDIYFLMALRRPDVWPRGDLALATALMEAGVTRAVPGRDEQEAVAARWAPWRSVAARLLWAHYLEARGQYQPGQPG
jgi:DNA-3-methyladenine glycosylase II